MGISMAKPRSGEVHVKVFATLLSCLVAIAIVASVTRLIRGENSSTEISWLYSQTAKSSEIIDKGNGLYRIVLHDVDLHTIQFSDRPDRLVEIVKTWQLVKEWNNLFSDSSPNAVLVEHDPNGTSDSLVVELQNPTYDIERSILTYEARLLSDEERTDRLNKLANSYAHPPALTGAVSLFIDNASSVNTGTKATTTTVKKIVNSTTTTTTTTVAPDRCGKSETSCRKNDGLNDSAPPAEEP